MSPAGTRRAVKSPLERDLDPSGEIRRDERKRTADDVSKITGWCRNQGEGSGRVVKKLGRALGASLVWSESTAAGHVVPGSSDLLRPIEDGVLPENLVGRRNSGLSYHGWVVPAEY